MKKKFIVFVSLFTCILSLGLYNIASADEVVLPSIDSEEYINYKNNCLNTYFNNSNHFVNLFSISDIESTVLNGITYSYSRNILTLNGTATESTVIAIPLNNPININSYEFINLNCLSTHSLKVYFSLSETSSYSNLIGLRPNNSVIYSNKFILDNGTSSNFTSMGYSTQNFCKSYNLNYFIIDISSGLSFSNAKFNFFANKSNFIFPVCVSNDYITDLTYDTYFLNFFNSYFDSGFLNESYDSSLLSSFIDSFASNKGSVFKVGLSSIATLVCNDSYNLGLQYRNSFNNGSGLNEEDLENAYNNGYNDGLNDNDTAYNNGYKDGELIHANDYNNGYNDGLLEGGKNSELKSILGPLYNGIYFGYIDGDSTTKSSVNYFNSDYQDLLVGNQINLNDIVNLISADLEVGTRYDIVMCFDKSVKLSDIDLAIRGVDGITYKFDDTVVYNVFIPDYRSLTNHYYDINKNINCIELTILNYDEFIKCNGTLIFNGLNELYLNGYNDGYANGYDGGLNDTNNNELNYNNGYKDGYDVAVDESVSKIEESYNNGVDYGYSDGYNDGYSNGIENSAQDYKTGYNDGYEVGHAQGIIEKNPVTFQSLFWTIATVPFETFKQIWTVDFLGFNIAQFLTGLFMSLITLWIIKRLLA